LRTFEPILDQQKMDEAHSDLRWLGQALGDVRDLDVLLESLHSNAGEAEHPLAAVFDRLAQRHREAEAALREALSSERYAGLVKRIGDLARDPTFVVAGEGSCETVLPDLVWRMWRKLEKAGSELHPASPESEFHRARILAKRARYAAETVFEMMTTKFGKRLRPFAEGAESVQNVLGEHLDATFARQTLQAIAPEIRGDGLASFELGRLVERYDQVARAKRREFFKEWGKLDRRRNLEWANR
jgi:CHAD domain-containing protein